MLVQQCDKDNTKITVVLLEICFVETSISHLLVDVTFECECIPNDPDESPGYFPDSC